MKKGLALSVDGTCLLACLLSYFLVVKETRVACLHSLSPRRLKVFFPTWRLLLSLFQEGPPPMPELDFGL